MCVYVLGFCGNRHLSTTGLRGCLIFPLPLQDGLVLVHVFFHRLLAREVGQIWGTSLFKLIVYDYALRLLQNTFLGDLARG